MVLPKKWNHFNTLSMTNPVEKMSVLRFLDLGILRFETARKKAPEEHVTFDQLTKLLKLLIIKESGKSVELKPKIVVAVHYQEIQRSPNYKSGFALRFPRVTALREDKPLKEIATIEEIGEDFSEQANSWRYG